MELPQGVAFLLIGAAVVVSFSLLLLLHYARREVKWFSFLPSLFAFSLSLCTITLIPYDVWETLMLRKLQQQHDEAPPSVIADSSWEWMYWVTFLLSWFVIPVLIEFEAAGDFSVAARFRTSFQRRALQCGAYFLFAFFVVISAFAGHGAYGTLGAWSIAISNAWGLSLAVVLMGYGLVAVPRHFWRLASPGEYLQNLYCTLVVTNEARLSALLELQDVISEGRTEITLRHTSTWDGKLESAFAVVQQTLEECEQLHCELTNGARSSRDSQSCGMPRENGESLRVESLAHLHRSLKEAAMEARRAACRWDALVQRGLLLEDLEEQIYPSEVQVAASWQAGGWLCSRVLCRWHVLRSCSHQLLLMWFQKLRRYVLQGVACWCGVFSVAIVLGQLTMLLDGWPSFLLSFVIWEEHDFWTTQFFCIVPLIYMICVAYWSIFGLKMAGWYGLYPNCNTDPGSLLWCSLFFARLTAPLCYHYLLLIRVDGTKFQDVMGRMNVVPLLGQPFNKGFPIFVGVLCLCNLTNTYQRFVQILGWDTFYLEWTPQRSADGLDLLAEGRRLIERERRHRCEERSLLELHDRNDVGHAIPLRLQIAQLVEDGALPHDWNAYCS